MADAAESPVDPGAITALLVEHGVDFVVVGGVAVQAQGYTRATNDLDIVPNPELANLSRLSEALVELDAVLARGVRAIDIADPQVLRRAPLVPLADEARADRPGQPRPASRHASLLR